MTAPPPPAELDERFAAPARASRPDRSRARPGGRIRSLAPTLAVAAVIGSVVFGGLAVDAALPLPAIGRVTVVEGTTIEAAPGWRLSKGPASDGIVLQRGDVLLRVGAVHGVATPQLLLSLVMEATDKGSAQIVFGQPHDVRAGDRTVVLATYQATIPDVGVPIDGEIVVDVVAGTGLVFNAYAPQGDLAGVAGDVLQMVGSVEVSP